MKIQSIKGTSDITAPEIRKWQYIEELTRELFKIYGYQEIRTPIIEHTDLFTKGIGQATDIVKKEMFTFKDKACRSITLRPEETASVARAYLESKMYKKSKLVKLYYIGPMFRSEKPQAGRMRQFHQIGVEAIGSYDAYLDAEIIDLMQEIVNEIGLKKTKLLLNTLGCLKDRLRYKEVLRSSLDKNLKRLCRDCKVRFKVNPLRILDCKNPQCQKIIERLPVPSDYICSECKEHFDKVKDLLDSLKIDYTFNPRLVRGLDYYTRTTFELIHPDLGAKNAICAGGRYDNLISSFGGPETGACGFAFGLERVLLAKEAERVDFKEKEKDSVYIATVNETNKTEAFKLLKKLHTNHIKAYFDYEGKSLKAQMRQANKLNCKYVIVVGEDELRKKRLTLKDMRAHSQQGVNIKNLISTLNKNLNLSEV